MSRCLALLGIALLAGCSSPSPRAPFRDYTAEPQAATPVQPQAAAAPQSTATQLAVAPGDDAVLATRRPQSLKAGTQQASAPASAAAAAPAAKPPRPPAYRQAIAAYVKRYAVDPNSLQQGKIGQPFDGAMDGQSGSIVCVELQGKQDFGRTAYLLRNNTVIDSQYEAPVCNDQHLDPW